MIHFTDRTRYFLSSEPTDMRKGCNGLSCIIRERMQLDPLDYSNAYIFYSKDYRKIKILHHDLSGFVLYEKWFDNGKFLKPEFQEARTSHCISKEMLMLLMTTAVQTRLSI